MTEVILINPRDEYLEKTGGQLGDRAPLGIGMLSAYLKLNGYETKIFDLNHDKKEELFQYNVTYDPEFVCIAVSTPNYYQCIDLAKALRNNKNRVVAGGNHVTDFPNEKKTLENFDYVITGDGEEALLYIIKNYPKQQIIASKPIENLNSLPLPDYEGLQFERYFMKIDGQKGAIVISSRGCKYHCCYCGSAKIQKWRSRSPEHVMRELRFLYNHYNVRGFYFADDIFTFNQQRVIELCHLMKKEFLDIVWRATTRADLLSNELCKAMAEAGCKWISLGIESGNDKVLRSMRKFMTVEQQQKGIEMCIENGISVKGFFIFPLPGDDKETIRETIIWAKGIKKKYGQKFITDIYRLVPYYATPLWDNPDQFGIEIYKTNNWEDYNQVIQERKKPLFKHPQFTDEEIDYWINEFKREVGENKMTG